MCSPSSCIIGLIHVQAGWHKRPLNQASVSFGLVCRYFSSFLVLLFSFMLFMVVVLSAKWLVEKVECFATVKRLAGNGLQNVSYSLPMLSSHVRPSKKSHIMWSVWFVCRYLFRSRLRAVTRWLIGGRLATCPQLHWRLFHKNESFDR